MISPSTLTFTEPRRLVRMPSKQAYSLPSPPASSQPLSQSDTLRSILSDIDLSTLPLAEQHIGQDAPSNNKTSNQTEQDSLIIKMVLLRKLFPNREDINWGSISDVLSTVGLENGDIQPGRVRSRFFSAMHGVTSAYNITHKELCTKLALPLEHFKNFHPKIELPLLASDPTDVLSFEKKAAIRKLNDLAFNAKLREAQDARVMYRPEVAALSRVDESCQFAPLKPKRALGTCALVASSEVNEILGTTPILPNPVPRQQSQSQNKGRTDHSSRMWPLSPYQRFNYSFPPRNLSPTSQVAGQVHNELRTHGFSDQVQRLDWNASIGGYCPRTTPIVDQNQWRSSKEIYNSAIAYHVKFRNGQQKQSVLVRENRYLGAQLRKKNSLNSGKSRKSTNRREVRDGNRETCKVLKRKSKNSLRIRKNKPVKVTNRTYDSSGKAEILSKTTERMRELERRLLAKQRLGLKDSGDKGRERR